MYILKFHYSRRQQTPSPQYEHRLIYIDTIAIFPFDAPLKTKVMLVQRLIERDLLSLTYFSLVSVFIYKIFSL